ncbi:hypothetical protein BOX15_Mlig020892g1, partial [Macrostomum lignano]
SIMPTINQVFLANVVGLPVLYASYAIGFYKSPSLRRRIKRTNVSLYNSHYQFMDILGVSLGTMQRLVAEEEAAD